MASTASPGCSAQAASSYRASASAPNPDRPTVILYDGQRRYLAAQASHSLAGSEGTCTASPSPCAA